MVSAQASTGLLWATFVAAVVLQSARVEWFLARRYHAPFTGSLDAESLEAHLEEGGSYDTFLPTLQARFGPGHGIPLVISQAAGAPWSTEELVGWVEAHGTWLTARLEEHGAILFRNFSAAVVDPRDFEAVSLALEPALEETYIGTSPRRLLPGCRFVHTASEFPDWVVVPAHCEMSFRHDPPRRIFFFAHAPNESPGGETPLVDFRQVHRDLGAAVLGRFERGGLRYIRHYYDERAGNWDPYKTKSWQAMFATDDPAVAEERSAAQGFEWSWEHNRSGTLKLVHVMNATRLHPSTGDTVWHNHLNVLHLDADVSEYAYTAQHLRSWKFLAIHHALGALVRLQELVWGGEHLGHHVTHRDGSPILAADIVEIRQAVWRNTIAYRHQQGDIAMLDNWRVGHARQPYDGARSILTTWA